jgi:hypothetical protein
VLQQQQAALLHCVSLISFSVLFATCVHEVFSFEAQRKEFLMLTTKAEATSSNSSNGGLL